MMLCMAHFRFFEIVRTIDQRNMCKRLRIVPQCFGPVGTNLLRKQPKLTGITEQPLEERSCLGNTSLHREVVDQPERTDSKGALTPRQSVVGMIPVNEATLIGQALHDAIHGGAHARIIGSNEA